MSKGTIITVGVYSVVVLIFVYVFYLSPHQVNIQKNNPSFLEGNNLKPINDQRDNNPNGVSLPDLFEKSNTGVVIISVVKSNETNNRALASGVIYDSSGDIITNNHVVENTEKIRVTFHEGITRNAKIVGRDPYTDLAVIKVDADPSIFHPLSLGDSKKLRIGDQVAVIGNPFGLAGSMTSGIVSQTGRLLSTPDTTFSIPDIIQTDAAINPGNSGGPLLDMDGHVIGINTAIRSNTGEFSGVSFAIPSSTVSKVVPALIKNGQYHHPWLGISGVDITSDMAESLGLPVKNGFLVGAVVNDSSADKAGLHSSKQTQEVDGIKYKTGGDIIVSVDGRQVKKIDDIISYLQDQKNVGDKITLGIMRDDKLVNVDLTLQERPQQSS